ncbi:MAG TPA: acyl-CoA synthetase [Thermoanaerobaculia bacterium]|nr:acyl-CoA synthetase [Thermoanaerobaculia bacterium]
MRTPPESSGKSGTGAVLSRLAAHGDRPALLAGGVEHSYRELLSAAAAVATSLRAARGDLAGERVALLAEPGRDFVASLLAIWSVGAIAVPLALSHPEAERTWLIEDSGASVVLSAAGVRALPTGGAPAAEAVDPPALLIYTSGTTSRPKGVVWSHGMLTWQLETLTRAWGWRADDRTLLALPLHHVHGLVNVLLCCLWAGARCEVLPRFDPEAVWERLAAGEVSVWMAVPTLYHRLLGAWDAAPPAQRERWAAGARGLRLAVSGSAALPAPLFERWAALAGRPPLERYGMTEIGMALSNPLDGERVAGSVGSPLPGVEVRRVDEQGQPVAAGETGELEVRGPGVFQTYWRRPAETAAFRDGWFRTGDVAVCEHGRYRLLGRASQDIVKTGGYKVSALEIEAVLLGHPAVAECAVVGLADPEWGERVGAAVVLAPGARVDLEGLRSWAREHLAPYKLPTRLVVLSELPKNALGKVVKGELRGRFGEGDESAG